MMLKPTKDWLKMKPLYKPVRSSRGDKKGMVFVKKDGKKRLIHFGAAGYTDKTRGATKAQQKSYLARSAGIRDKSGRLTKDDRDSANYWSRRKLW
jgi:hypothetical protein